MKGAQAQKSYYIMLATPRSIRIQFYWYDMLYASYHVRSKVKYMRFLSY